MTTTFPAAALLLTWAEALHRSLQAGRLEAEQKQLDGNYVPHELLLRRGLCTAGTENEALNRYSNLFPLDANRVLLRSGPRDFVNASHVVMTDLCDEKRGWIIAQGPMHPDWHGPDTLGDFWRLVMEQDVHCVVSMAKESTGYSGFARWWPDGGPGSQARFGDFLVRVEREELTPCGNLRREMMALRAPGQEGRGRKILHLQTVSWPNYGTPGLTEGILELLGMCREARAVSSAGGPTLVHCSGGVGRSGTFVATYVGLASTLWAWSGEGSDGPKDGASFSLLPVVESLRRQRHSMCVEGIAQLSFSYRCICDAVGNFAPPND